MTNMTTDQRDVLNLLTYVDIDIDIEVYLGNPQYTRGYYSPSSMR